MTKPICTADECDDSHHAHEIRTATVNDIATHAGVSLRTAHRVISGGPHSEKARARIEAAMAALGFTPHQKRPRQTFTCLVDDCDKRGPGRICGMHRERMRNTGTYDLSERVPADDVFWTLVNKTDDCWTWSGWINPQGYGFFSGGHVQQYAHRYAYQLLVGPIAAGLQLDHVCHSRDQACIEGPACLHRRCCNPAHLEPVTSVVNMKRSVGRRLACRRGHPWVASNIYSRPDTGSRTCRTCAQLRYGAKKRGVQLVPVRRIASAA